MSQVPKRAVKQINVMKEEKLIVPPAHTKMTQEHKTEHPINAGAQARFREIDVKLKGPTANTKPSKPLLTVLFHWPKGE